ncbi:MAG: MFS transporter [Gammaproteobacteria bacterium]|nr:MFS transporter [Gammaproteobacteria bacterium]MCY4219419.1 MFS transporter [Gammaproteobacteria bacterium]MCY4274083.1 MFS transporter [Gammaproteobacteria bacterium]
MFQSKNNWQTVPIILIAGCLIAMIGFGIRASFGLYLEPMTSDNGWTREIYGLAMALQNLFWGLGLPIAGALADKHGTGKIIIGGAILYSLGIWGMAESEGILFLQLTGGIMVGLGIAFSAFTLAIAAMVRAVGPDRRSLVMGVGTAAGSMGQVVFSPVSQGFISAFGWFNALLISALIILIMVPLAFCLPNSRDNIEASERSNQTLRSAVTEALSHNGYVLLTLGFFVCGFHVAFITVHLPAYIQDLGMNPLIGAYSIALIGIMNIFGSIGSGIVGQKWSKKYSLSTIYLGRSIVTLALLMAPKTPLVMLLFASAMGILWLSTVPLTTGIIAQVFGIRYMGTLFGIVFLSHQLGSFMGIWLGGRIYDETGSYNGMWWASIALGIFAAIVHLPINEKPITRLSTKHS